MGNDQENLTQQQEVGKIILVTASQLLHIACRLPTLLYTHLSLSQRPNKKLDEYRLAEERMGIITSHIISYMYIHA